MSAETIFFIALLLFYFIVQASARKKQTGQKQQPPSRQQRSRLPRETGAVGSPAGSEWQDALREIHEKLALSTATQPPDQSTSVAPLPPARLKTQPTRFEKARAVQDEFRPSFSPNAIAFESGLGIEQPVRLEVWHDDVTSKPHAAPLPLPDGDKTAGGKESVAARNLRDLLRDPEAVRHNIVVAELLSPPLSRRRRRS